MKPETTCYGCLVTQADTLLAGMTLPREKRIAAMREVLALISTMDEDAPPPNYGREIHSLIKRITGNSDPYAEHKRRSNDTALSLAPGLREIIENSEDPLMAALQVSISGNIIDYGAPGSGEMADIRKSIDEALAAPLEKEVYASFKADLAGAGTILILGDNAGEIVFDGLLIERLAGKNVTYAVRGDAMINDATRDDARYTGIDKIALIIDTGDDTPGIVPGRASGNFLDHFMQADLIISKGQGNFETLYGEDMQGNIKKGTPIYFLFKAKCLPVSRVTGLPLGSPAFLRFP